MCVCVCVCVCVCIVCVCVVLCEKYAEHQIKEFSVFSNEPSSHLFFLVWTDKSVDEGLVFPMHLRMF